MSLLSLHVEDIFIPHILPYLSVADVWVLRMVCRQLHDAVYLYYSKHMTAIIVKHSDIIDIYPGVCTILRNAYKLKYLEVTGGDREHDMRLLESLVQSPSPPTLNQLSLSLFHLSGDDHMIMNQLAQCCTHLKVLVVHNVMKLSDCLLQVLLQHLLPRQRGLKHLHLRDCAMSIHQEQLSQLLHLKHLEVLRLQCILAVNERTLETVSEFCPALKSIDISLCPNVANWMVLQNMKERGVVVESHIPPFLHSQKGHVQIRYQI